MLVATLAIVLRLIPEILAYPHPIGYDVVNYYIPVVTYFNENWPAISDDFPLYVLILYFVASASGLRQQGEIAKVAHDQFRSGAGNPYGLSPVANRDANAPAVRLEASGGLTVESARAVADTGVDSPTAM